MNKEEVGMYVRTKIGVIGKIISIDKDSHNNNIITIFNGNFHIIHNETRTEFDITKASHNIIDLIEEKDLLIDTKNNLYVVDRVDGDYVFTTSKNEYGLIITLVDYQIKSIVTKEQFESMSYKLGDSNE